MSSQVVISGISIISCLGDKVSEVISRLSKGCNAYKEIANDADMSCRYSSCYDDFDATEYLGKKGVRALNRCTKMLLAGVMTALDDANLTIDEHLEERVGVILASNFGVEAKSREMGGIVYSEGPKGLSPLSSYYMSINGVASQVSIWTKAKAFNLTVSSGYTSGFDGVVLAKNYIQSGRADVVIMAGAEELSIQLIKDFDRQGLLAKSFKESLPFFKGSDGMILGDGAAVIIIESYKHAVSRKAKFYSSIGSCLTSFVYEMKNHYGFQIRNLFLREFSKSVAFPDSVDMIMSSANGTVSDMTEYNAYANTFNPETLIFNVKSYFGECFAFTDLLQIVFGAYALRNRAVLKLPIIGRLKDVIGFRGDKYKNNPLTEINTVLVGSVGADGKFASLLLNAIDDAVDIHGNTT